MAQSPAHKFGQLIGNILEDIMLPLLEEYCSNNNLYLDHRAKKRTIRRGKKVTWEDLYGNKHDLDFVIEKDGSDDKRGNPVAFIECAWRRYTKHSRNKAQEIQGAILPLAEKYKWLNPFLGVILAGVFTNDSLKQLESLGFHILYFPYKTIIDAFEVNGIDIKFDEQTPDEEFKKCIETINNTNAIIKKVGKYLVNKHKQDINIFLKKLESRLERLVDKVIIVPLFGKTFEFTTINEAIEYLTKNELNQAIGPFKKYEIKIEFSNGDKVEGEFKTKERVIEFLEFITKN